MTQPTTSTASRPPKQGTWNWLLSSCFGKDHGSHADDASSTRKRSGTGTSSNSNYGGIGYNTPFSATAANSLNTSLAGSSSLHHGKNPNKNSNNKGDLWVNAMNALLAEIEARQETKVPSFNWRMRSNYGTGSTCVGPEGAKWLSHLLAEKCRERRGRIAALTVRLSGNGGCNSCDDVNTGGNKLLIDAATDTSGDFNVATSSSCAAIQTPASDEERAKLTTELAILESSAAHAVKHLDLRGQQVSDEGAAALGELLAEDDCIEILTLVKNNISPKGIIALAEGIAQNRGTLKRLVLGEGNEIDSKATVHLCRAIRSQQMQMRKESSFASNGRSGYASVASSSGGGGSGGSHSYNSQRSPQQSVLRTGAATNGSSNTVLSANATMIVVPPTAASSHQQQSEFAGTSNGLVDLEIGFGPNFTLNDDAMMAIRDACFSSSSTLRTVKVSPSPKAFTAASLGAILRGLAQNRKLNTLILTNCVEESTLYGPNGARPLLEPFATGALCRVDSPLRTLEISNIAIGDSGAKVLADALRLRTAAQLRTLTLTKCSIGVFGFEMLGAMMDQNPYLARVDVSGNLNNNSTYGGNTNNQDAPSEGVENATMLNAVKKGDQARALILGLCGLGSSGIGTSSKSASPAPNGMSPAGVRRSSSASYASTPPPPPCGLQELFISDYHVTSDAVSALLDALTRGGAAGQPSLSAAALRLRTFRYGSCDAPDGAQTRLHNLISENNEEYLVIVAAKEKQQQQQTLASPEARAQQAGGGGGGGGGAGLGSSTRRAIVTFTSGGLPTTVSNPHAREGSYSANSYAYHDGEVALASSSRGHYRSASAASSVPRTPHSPNAAATLNFAASSAFFNSNNSIVSVGSGKNSATSALGAGGSSRGRGDRKETEGEEQKVVVGGGDLAGSAFSHRSDSATPDGRSAKQQHYIGENAYNNNINNNTDNNNNLNSQQQQQEHNAKTTEVGHNAESSPTSSVAKDLTELMSPNPRAPPAAAVHASAAQYQQQQENETEEVESREDFVGQGNRHENNIARTAAAAADIDEIELDF